MLRRAPVRVVALLVAVAALAALGPVAGVGQERAAEPPPGEGRTEVVSAPAPGVAGAGAGEQPDVSADGRTVAFVSSSPLLGDVRGTRPGPARIFVRDVRTGVLTELAAGPDEHAVPSVSADGRLVAFARTRAGVFTDLVVADRAEPERPVLRRVSGVRGDLPYQRLAACVSRDAQPRCGPELSADGRTLVFPVTRSVFSPSLALYTMSGQARRDLTDGTGFPVALLDLGGARRPGAVPQQSVHVAVRGPDPVELAAPSVEGPFRILPEGTTCGTPGATVIRPGFACRIQVSFDATGRDCRGPAHLGMLAVNSPVPAGQVAVALVADAAGAGCASAPSRARPTCPGSATVTRGPALIEAARDGSASGDGARRINLGEVRTGGSTVLAVPIRNVGKARSGDRRLLSFAATDCSLRLVVPEQAPQDNPPACRPGTELSGPGLVDTRLELADLVRTDVQVPPGARACTAYLRFAPGAVRPYAATLTLRPAGGDGAAVRYRIAAAGSADVVAVRRAPAGDGDFAAAGTRARVVSRDDAGAVVTGTDPVVSGDGRHVAFVSPVVRGGGRSRQILLHDTDAAGDGSFRTGRTSFVSVLPGGGQPASAGSPAVSADGAAVAFEAVLTDGQGGPEDCVGCRQVFVRDVAAQRTLAGSPSTGDRRNRAYGNGDSHSPAFSADGSTLAYVSTATDLLPGERPLAEVGRIFLRDLGPDRGGPGAARTDDVPTGIAVGPSGYPTISGDGGAIAFQAAPPAAERGAAATPDPAAGGGTQVLLRTRYGRAEVAPADVRFVDQELGTRSPAREITVRNAGPGPLTARILVPEGPFAVVDGCAGRTLHRDESCAVRVAFLPTALGDAAVTLTVVTTTAGRENPDHPVAVSGTAIRPLLTVVPAEVRFPPQGLEQLSEPLTVTVTNIGPEQVRASATADPGGEFVILPGTCGSALAPGRSCTIRTAFRPAGLGERRGELTLVASRPGQGNLQRVIPAAGSTLAPELLADPGVVRRGRVATLTGTNFAPGSAVQITATDGRAVTQVRTDREGTFQVPLVVLSQHPLGSWELSAVSGPTGPIAVPPLLVTAGTYQPPGFTTRR